MNYVGGMDYRDKFLEMVDEGLIEESKYGKGYYVVKSI